ncbi:MAG: phosphatase PAP2 family protein [Treponema sp.]|jgi:membrane-associated phospholipid phosphatase|nr:phosphatase PAP2 family protein [Treponema sp.]
MNNADIPAALSLAISAAGAEDAGTPTVYQWGLAVIKRIQTWDNPVIDGFMRGISLFGAEAGYLALLLLIFWCIDEKKGVRLSVTLLFSAWINAFFKTLLHQPRPFQLDPSVGKSFEPTYGIPSGHAQMSFVFWTIVASWVKPQTKRGAQGKALNYRLRALSFALAILVSLVMGVSRLYLGVHFPTDLFAGWFLGGVTLACYLCFEEHAANFLAKSGLRVQFIISAAISFVLLLTGNTLLSGAMLGMGAGYALMLKFAPFTAKLNRGNGMKIFFILLARYITGLAGVGALFFVFQRFAPDKNSAYHLLAYFCQPVLLGLWIYAGAPWVFIRLHLAELAERGEESTGE